MLNIEAVLASAKDGKVDAFAVVELLRSASDEAHAAQSGAGAVALAGHLRGAAAALAATLPQESPAPVAAPEEAAPVAEAA